MMCLLNINLCVYFIKALGILKIMHLNLCHTNILVKEKLTPQRKPEDL